MQKKLSAQEQRVAEIYSKWMKDGYEALPGLARDKLARFAAELAPVFKKQKCQPGQVRRMMKGQPPIKSHQLATISRLIGRPVPNVEENDTANKVAFAPPLRRKKNEQDHSTALEINATFLNVPVDGTVAAGVFMEEVQMGQASLEMIPIAADEVYPRARHIAYKVLGNSMNDPREGRINDGDTIICVDFQDAGGTLVNGQRVVVERNRDGLIERSAKVVRMFDDRIEFQPRSTEKGHRPIVLSLKDKARDDVQVRVIALIRGAFRRF